MRRLLLPLCTLAVALTACDRHLNDYSCFHNIPADGWGYYHHLLFDVVPTDSVVTGKLDMVVRHDNDYPFSNLYVEVITESPHGPTRCDTLSVELADVYGNWLGSGPGTSFQRSVTLNPHFTVTDSARVRIRHVMRIDPVPHIEQIGLIFKAERNQQ